MNDRLLSSLFVLAGMTLAGCDDEGGRSPAPELGDTEWDDTSSLSAGDTDDDGDTDSAAGGDSRGSGNDTSDSGSDSSDSSDTADSGSDTSDSGSDTSDSGDTGSPPPSQGDCEPSALNLAGSGYISASSTYDTLLGPAYPAELVIDGDPGTSWFSQGFEVDGDTSTLEWYVMRDHCIDEITILGNGAHENADYHEGFGFEGLTLTLFDTSGAEVLRKDFDLQGTPDPTITLDAEGIMAHRILLELHDHESIDCGGFAELEITGRTQKTQ